MSRPKVAFAMQPPRTEHVISAEALATLAGCCDILSREPMTEFASAGAGDLLAGTEILVTGWGSPPVDAAALAKAPKLRLIAHAAGTVKGLIDTAAYDAGVVVTHAAQANALPVAEYTLAAIIFAGKQVFRFRDVYAADRDRRRSAAMQAGAIGNYRRIVGIVGASRIGRRVIELLRPFNFRIVLFDPMVTGQQAAELGVEKVDLDALMKLSDIVSLHAPSLASTRHMIGRRQLDLMKDGATLINTARGAIVDQDALVEVLKTGRIDAVLDVTEPEIPEETSPLYSLPNVFLTPHIAGAIGLERARLGEMAADEIARFVAGKPLLYEIRKSDLERMA